MPSTTPCVPCCTTPQSVNVPGVQGASAIALLTASFTIPSIGATLFNISVSDTGWMHEGQNIFIGSANFIIAGINSATSISATYIGITGDSAPASIIIAPCIISPGLGNYTVSVDLAPATVPAITNNTTGVATSTMAAGAGISTIAVSVAAASVLAGTIMAITPGYAFKILSVDAYAEVAITTGAKAATITPNIAGGAVTGGVISLAGTYAIGAKQAGSAVTAANTGTAAQEFTLVVSAVTAFTEGTFVFVIRIQNMDTANALATVASKINSILAAL